MTSKKFRAVVAFTPLDEGGMRRTPRAGIRPQLRLGPVLTSCVIRPLYGAKEMPVGVDHDVEVEIVFWDEYGKFFEAGMNIELHDGSRIIGRGRFL